MQKTIVITGATSGVGKAIYDVLVKDGHTVYSISRRDSINPYHIKCDITNDEDISKVIEIITRKEDKIDCLINCSGYGISGAIEFTEKDEIIKQFDVNFFGLVSFTNRFISLMRKQGYGKIINISSVAAFCPIPFQAFYSASKAALESYTNSLRTEVTPFNIQVCYVSLGDIKTSFTKNRQKNIEGDDIYHGVISRSVTKMEQDEQNGMQPSIIGRKISKLVFKKHLKLKYVIGLSYKAINLLVRVLPTNTVNKIIKSLYAK